MGNFKKFFENEDLKWVIFSILSIIFLSVFTGGYIYMLVNGFEIITSTFWFIIGDGMGLWLGYNALKYWTNRS